MTSRKFHIHLISDSTGETIHSLARACVAQFEDVEPVEHFWNLVRSPRQLKMVLEGIAQQPGPVVFSLVDVELRRELEAECKARDLPCVPVLDPVINALAGYLHQTVLGRPGRQHALDKAYFDRIDAMTFAMALDDGQNTAHLHEAEAILVGVSRTSKTPTCIYLANRGVRAANVPFVPNVPLPAELDEVSTPLVVGLTNDPQTLMQVRRQRLRHLEAGTDTDYVAEDQIREELRQARRHFASRGWPVINVARRSIEETAAEVMMLLTMHKQVRAKS
ncbi:MAG: pyruvate, water dikinase regulatory protein [Alphaproteobacteria bacterium]